MKSLNEDLKTGQFKQIYLLYGDENYLKKLYKDRLRKAMVPEGDTMNYSYFEGKGVDPKEVIDLSETMPFFADRRFLVFENTGMFKTASPELAEYLKNLPETSYFLFVENEIDKRGKLYKAVKDKGRIVELPFQDEATLKRWIMGAVKKEKKQISEKSIVHFLEKAGTDMGNIQMELEKLFSYTLEQDMITEEDIDAVCVTQISNKIFDMINAVADKKQRRALELYYDLVALKEPPMRILYLMTRQFRILMEVKDLMKHGFGQKEIASKAGLHPFATRKYMEQAKHFKSSELRRIIEESADIEERVKTGRLVDNIAVEVFIVKYSQP